MEDMKNQDLFFNKIIRYHNQRVSGRMLRVSSIGEVLGKGRRHCLEVPRPTVLVGRGK